MDPKLVNVRVTLDLQTDGETLGEELAWMLNLLRFEIDHWPRWNGRVRRIELLNPRGRGAGASSEADRQMELALPSPPESARGGRSD